IERVGDRRERGRAAVGEVVEDVAGGREGECGAEGEPREALALHDGTAPEAAGGRSDLDGVVEVGVEEAGAAAEAEPGGVVGDEQGEAEHEQAAPGVERTEAAPRGHPERYRHGRAALKFGSGSGV